MPIWLTIAWLLLAIASLAIAWKDRKSEPVVLTIWLGFTIIPAFYSLGWHWPTTFIGWIIYLMMSWVLMMTEGAVRRMEFRRWRYSRNDVCR